jgi:hypothetical protein
MVFQNDILAGAAGAGGGYTIDQSIRFNDDDSAYLTKTWSGSGDSSQIATASFWMKRGDLGREQMMFAADTNTNTDLRFVISSGDKLQFIQDVGGVTRDNCLTNAVFRDTSAWYHIVLRLDSTDATEANRIRMYVNGVQQTYSFENQAGLNENFTFNGNPHFWGRQGPSAVEFFDGYMAEINFLDGISADPTAFAEYNDAGVWIPKKYAGSYGTNGYYLTGADSANLGADESGNNNDFTSSGLTSDDQRSDTPTNNLMIFNPLNNMRGAGNATDGNRVFKNTGSTRNLCGTTFHFTTGKYVQAFSYNATGSNDWQIGSQPSDRKDVNDAPGSNEDLGEAPLITPIGTYYVGVGLVGTNNTGITADTADTIWVAIDLDAGKQWVGLYDNSAASMIWFDSSAGSTGDPATGANPVYTGTANRSYNFALCGRDSVEITLLEESEATGTVPTGFTYVGALKDTYAAPAVTDGSAYFNTILYTGDGSATTRSFTGVGFQPDFVWKKIRSSADHHWLHDAVRGATKGLNSNRTDSEYTSNRLTSFDSDGFSFATSDPDTNGSGSTYVAWNWLAGNGTASNTDGSITSTVSANTTAGFSVVTYTGTGSAATVGHGLGAEPQFIAIKGRTNVDSWGVYPGTSMGYGGQYRLKLNENSAIAASSVYWNNTDATSSVFTVNTDAQVNGSGVDYVAYCFAEVEGFSKMGRYTGNGSADGPFVWCGFRPAFILVKEVTAADDWLIYDSLRDPYNVAGRVLRPDSNAAEFDGRGGSRDVDFLSNGFKFRSSNATMNGSGAGYIFMAFAEHPFGGTDVASVPAR